MVVSDSFSFGQTVAVPAAPAVAEPTPSWATALSTGITALSKGAEIYGVYKASKVKPPRAPAAAPSFAPQYYQPPPPDEGMSMKKIALIGGGAVVVLGLVYFLTRK